MCILFLRENYVKRLSVRKNDKSMFMDKKSKAWHKIGWTENNILIKIEYNVLLAFQVIKYSLFLYLKNCCIPKHIKFCSASYNPSFA